MSKRRQTNVDIVYEDDEFLESPQQTEAPFATATNEAVLETAVEGLKEYDSAQIFQSYQEEESSIDVNPISVDLQEEEIEDALPLANQEIVLLDYFPTTTEEHEKGFRRISPKEKKAWGITQLEEEYDTIPGMAAVLGVSRNTVESWIYQCLEYFPSMFFKTRRGLTLECLKVLELYRDYCGGDNYTKTKKTRFLKKLEEQWEQYQAHMQDYLQKLTIEQTQSTSALTHASQVIDGEFVDEERMLQIQVSFERSDRKSSAAIEDYALKKAASTIYDVYQKVANLKPLMDQAIQNGLTGQDLPNLSQVINKD